MEQLFEFLVRHWALTSSLFIILILIIRMEMGVGAASGVQTLLPPQVVHKMNKEQAVILDTRDEDAYNNGHIINAMHFPPQELEKRIKKLNKYKEKPIIVVCEGGHTSPKLARSLHKQGFEHVFCLKNGLSSWREAQLPLTQSTSQDK